MIDRGSFAWPNGCSGAVSLTYDDGRRCHWEVAAPQLDEAGLRGTFNPTIKGQFLRETATWAALASQGHELGNHTLFHPCYSVPPTVHDWLNPAYNLADYTERRFRDEVEVANWILTTVDKRNERTYANTCYDNWIGRDEKKMCLEPILGDYFVASRGEHSGTEVDIASVNYQNLGTWGADRRPFEEVRDTIEDTLTRGNWLVVTLHSVAGGKEGHLGHEDVHRRLVGWLADNGARVWTAPMIEVAKYLAEHECPING